MGKIIISDNVSLDGVIQDPAGNEGFRHDGWSGRPAAHSDAPAACTTMSTAPSWSSV
jgi:hypothetical protein